MNKDGRRDWIRTSDPLDPNQVRYQAALLADDMFLKIVRRKKMGWMMGLEPTTTGITIRGSTN